jgi:hypothetical protein
LSAVVAEDELHKRTKRFLFGKERLHVKIIEKPIYVEKKVHIPVDRPVYIEKKIQVPVERPVYIEKKIQVPVDRPVYIEKPVPYVVEKNVEVPGKVLHFKEHIFGFLEHIANKVRNLKKKMQRKLGKLLLDKLEAHETPDYWEYK